MTVNIILLHRQGRLIHRQFSTGTVPHFAAKTGFIETFGGHFGLLVNALQSTLEMVHASTGLPWWSTIMMGAATLRLSLLPIKANALLHQAKIQMASQDLSNRLPEYKQSIERNLQKEREKRKNEKTTIVSEKYVKVELARKWLELMRARGTHPARTLLPILLNLPLFFTFTATLRKMSAFPWPFLNANQNGEDISSMIMVEGWSTEGLWFFSNLAIPSLPLTIIVVLSNFATIEWIFRQNSVGKKRPQFPRWLMHGANCLSLYLLSIVPAAINFFILCNNGLSVLEGILSKSPLVRRWVERRAKKIPKQSLAIS